MKRQTGFILLGLLIVFSLPAQSQEKARLVFYRVREFMSGTGYDIAINQQWKVNLRPRDFVQLELPPGKIDIEAGGFPARKKHLSLTLQPGQTLYLRGVEEIDFLEQYLLMSVIPPEEALREMKAIKRMREVKAVKR